MEGIGIKNHWNESLPLISKLKLVLPKIDTVALNSHLISSQTLTKWFQSLERLMKYSLAKSIFDLIDEKVKDQLEENHWRDHWKESKYPSQVILFVEHFLFGVQLQKLLEQPQRTALINFKYQIEEQFNHFHLNNPQRDQAILSQRLYFRDVLTSSFISLFNIFH